MFSQLALLNSLIRISQAVLISRPLQILSTTNFPSNRPQSDLSCRVYHCNTSAIVKVNFWFLTSHPGWTLYGWVSRLVLFHPNRYLVFASNIVNQRTSSLVRRLNLSNEVAVGAMLGRELLRWCKMGLGAFWWCLVATLVLGLAPISVSNMNNFPYFKKNILI